MSISDTSEQAAKFQIALLKSKSTSERLALTLTLSSTTIGLSRRAIERANPEFTMDEVRNKFVELHYGKQLAEDLSKYLQERASDSSE